MLNMTLKELRRYLSIDQISRLETGGYIEWIEHLEHFWIHFKLMKTITLRTGRGFPKGTVELILVTPVKWKHTHNGDGKFSYQQGWDINYNRYETRSRGGGWRLVTKEDTNE